MAILVNELGYNGSENVEEIFRLKKWNPIDLVNMIWYSPLEFWQKKAKIQELKLDCESSCQALLEFYGFVVDRPKLYNLYLKEYLKNFDGENFTTKQICNLYLGLSYQSLYKKLERENVIRKNANGFFEMVNGEPYIIIVKYEEERFGKTEGIQWTREGKAFIMKWLAEREIWPAEVFERAEGLFYK